MGLEDVTEQISRLLDKNDELVRAREAMIYKIQEMAKALAESAEDAEKMAALVELIDGDVPVPPPPVPKSPPIPVPPRKFR